jgi:hypothetical protein
MLKRKFFIIFLLSLIAFSSHLLTACGNQSTTNVQVAQSIPTITSQPTSIPAQNSPTSRPVVQTVRASQSYIVAYSLEELVAKSTTIVIGQPINKAETFNGARAGLDNELIDPNNYGLVQTYNVAVERYLKGNGSDQVKIAQVEAFLITNGLTPTTNQIEDAKANYGAVPLKSGQKYLFFLRPFQPVSAFPGLLTGSINPWRIVLLDTGEITPEVAWSKQLESSLIGKSANNFITEVETVIAKNPTITPVPTSPPKPTARAKAGDALNLVKFYNLDKAVYIRVEWHGSSGLDYKDSNKIKDILSVLDTPITTVERTTPPSSKVENYAIIYFGFSDDTWISFGYYREEGVFRNGNFDLNQKLMIPVPTKLAEVLGLPPLTT